MSVFSSDRFFSSTSLATLSMPRSEISAPHNSNFVKCGKLANRSRSPSFTCARQVDAGHRPLIILGHHAAGLLEKRDVLGHVGPGLRAPPTIGPTRTIVTRIVQPRSTTGRARRMTAFLGLR